MAHIYRRILKNEIEKFKAIQDCESARRLFQFYDKHTEWIDKVAVELENRKRIAFGCFYGNSDQSNHELLGSIMVKRYDYSNEEAIQVEVKNLIVDKDKLESLYRNTRINVEEEDSNIQKTLIEHVIKFCNVRGYHKLIIEIPTLFKQTINLFLDCGFYVVSSHEKYSPGKMIYNLERKLGDFYFGDPFSLSRITRWMARNVFNFDRFSRKPGLFYRDTIISAQKYIGESHPLKREEHVSIWNDLTIKHEFVIIYFDEDVDKTIEDPLFLFRKSSDVKYLVTYASHDDLAKRCETCGIKYLSKDSLFQILGEKRSSLTIPFDRDDVGGIVCNLELNYLEEIRLNTVEEGPKEFVFYIMSGHGHYIDWYDEDNLPIMIMCNPERQLIAYCNIVSVTSMPYKDASLEYAQDVYYTLEEDDIAYYQTYSENDHIIVLHCSTPVFPKWNTAPLVKEVLTKQMNDYYDLETDNQFISAMYLDFGSREKLKGFIAREFENNANLDGLQNMKKITPRNIFKDIEWDKVLLSALNNIPVVNILAAPLKETLNQIDNSLERDELLFKIQQMNDRLHHAVTINRELTRKDIHNIFDQVISSKLGEKVHNEVSRTIADLLNTYRKYIVEKNEMPSVDAIRNEWVTYASGWELPVQDKHLKQEMQYLFEDRGNFRNFRNIVETNGYRLSFFDENDPIKTLNWFVDSLKGMKPEKYIDIFRDLFQQHAGNSKLLNVIIVDLEQRFEL